VYKNITKHALLGIILNLGIGEQITKIKNHYWKKNKKYRYDIDMDGRKTEKTK